MQHPFSMEFDEQEQLALFESILIEGFRTNHPHVYTGTITEFVRNKMGWETHWLNSVAAKPLNLTGANFLETILVDEEVDCGDVCGDVCQISIAHLSLALFAPDLKLKKLWFQVLSSVLMLQSTTLTLLIALLFSGVEPLGVWCVVLEFTCVVA